MKTALVKLSRNQALMIAEGLIQYTETTMVGFDTKLLSDPAAAVKWWRNGGRKEYLRFQRKEEPAQAEAMTKDREVEFAIVERLLPALG